MGLSEEIKNNPTKSELEVFKDFVDKATSIQQQLSPSYHEDRNLREMVMIGVNIPRIQESLGDRQPRVNLWKG